MVTNLQICADFGLIIHGGFTINVSDDSKAYDYPFCAVSSASLNDMDVF